jgi:hypothetical protein
MLIIDALRRATTAQEVCYLLTSYVETLPFYDRGRRMPAGVTALPVRGLDDIRARLSSLLALRRHDAGNAAADTDCAVLDEVMHLFSEAVFRLEALDTCDHAHFSFDRRAAARPSPAHHA